MIRQLRGKRDRLSLIFVYKPLIFNPPSFLSSGVRKYKHMEEDYISKTMMTIFAAVLVSIILRLVHRIWWIPRSIEKSLRRQGIRGTSYRFFSGDLSEIRRCTLEATSKPLSLSHQILPRVIPFFHNLVHQYGKFTTMYE